MNENLGQEQILNSPQNLELNNNQEGSQKNEFLEQILKAKVNEDLIQCLIIQLNQAKMHCSELIKENSKNEETHLKNIMQIIENSLERIKTSKNNLENDISSNSVSQESYFNQGTSISNQDNFLTNINYVSDLNKQIAFVSQAILQSPQEEEQYELQRGSEQFRHSEQYSDYYQMHNHQQQQKQIQQIMSQEEDQQSPISHRINEELTESKLVKYRAIAKQIYNFNLELRELQVKVKEDYKQIFSDQIQQTAQYFDTLIDKYQDKKQELQQKENQELQQFYQTESVVKDDTKLNQLLTQYLNKIKDYFISVNLEVKGVKEQILKFVENQFHAFSEAAQKLLLSQSKITSTEKNKQIEQLKKNHQIEIKQKEQEIIDLNKKLNEAQEYLNLTAFNDNNICSKITQINRLLEQTSQSINQTTQKLDYNNLEEMISQIRQINQTFTGETQDDIKNLKTELNKRDEKIQQLEAQKQQYENQIKNNNHSAILEKKIEDIQSKYNQQFNQTDQIYQKTTKIEEIREELRALNSYIQGEQDKLKNKYEEEKKKAIQTWLEGSFKLQDRSLLYIQLGLKIFQQYYNSHNQNGQKIKSQTDKLIKFHENYQKKEYFKLTDLQQIQQFYTNQEKELKALFDDSFNEYKNFIAEITKRRYQ
ncbi:unnamed protein product (macronuclear) [Paramecium tetraurelia]|uniref:Uncharacterized protein n=1 Tax=Paramecium tetraurelia TaxID=5888 RepID=A0DGE2_PARTE|nr:uncharacterized protein GSPATT00002238001 [Paramecium tetraurelia]CAK82109.1 unnamed protein product [Paramecium tetraurelia]|eukprot:XP_001449506.1 hypothetical protein (macronuclear) [Paramecium tetraurelia strain d4-2]